ncbi:hypothetical protein LG200_05750 [Methylobacillus caricis]|uniref:hypothetical protein n=1 Tax=Methylobacillus caricis TaxID=1971611 RepID=UPI001CFFAEBB|nr:hypothetical protein [Methylobacillus caricis]MCB5187510.1 hypothetical protein [Methylobacillus caricis]
MQISHDVVVRPRVVHGWRHDEIGFIYDRAVEIDGYYFKEGICGSSQTMARTEITRNYRKDPENNKKVRAIDNKSKAAPLGRTNQIAVLKSIRRQKMGDLPHPKAKIFTLDEWNAIKAVLIARGELNPDDNTPPNQPLTKDEKLLYYMATNINFGMKARSIRKEKA